MESLPSPGLRWPVPPSGPELSVRDVGLLDLARHAAMRAAMPLGTIAADTDELWHLLRAAANEIDPALSRDAILDDLQPRAMAWAEQRAAERVRSEGDGA